MGERKGERVKEREKMSEDERRCSKWKLRDALLLRNEQKIREGNELEKEKKLVRKGEREKENEKEK